MPPIAKALIKMTQRLKDPVRRHMTLNLVERATQQPDLAHFTNAVLKNPTHTSHSDPRPHVTALLFTNDQAQRDISQAVHIYHDGDGNYVGHTLYEERLNKPTDN